MSHSNTTAPIVALCASAGGLNAFKSFFSDISLPTGMTYVIIQHLSPEHKDLLVDILTSFQRIPVIQIKNRMRIVANTIYVIPPNSLLEASNGQFFIQKPKERKELAHGIDFFLNSLAKNYGDQAIALILSGTGTDGTAGIKKIKELNGFVLVQSPATAKHKEMPESAERTQVADFVLPIEKMATTIEQHLSNTGHQSQTSSSIVLSDLEFDQHSEAIFAILKKKTGHDFSNYKRNTLIRRLERRLNARKKNKLSDYLHLIENDSEETQALNQEFLISVTHFFREPEFFENLAKQVIPKIIKKAGHNGLRIWVPACATGEEAYSIAILVDQYLLQNKLKCEVKIFASDIDLWAIEKARAGIYPASIKNYVKEDVLANYFVYENETYRVKIRIREMIIFAEQNVLAHPPYSLINLISCRNFLIYLNNELQQQVLTIFHYALGTDGFLFLGNSENLGNSANLFSIFNRKAKIFRKANAVQTRKQLWNFNSVKIQEKEKAMRQKKNNQLQLEEVARNLVLNRFTPPSIIINSNDDILFFQGKTHKFLEQPTGEPTFNIIHSAKENIKLSLAHTIRNAKSTQQEVKKKHVRMDDGDTTEFINIIVSPIKNNDFSEDLYLVTFENSHLKTQKDELPIDELLNDQGKINELEKELKETQEYLQSTIEELETTNEELKASNEEEQSINEELQSANEELETSKEELQAVNEELNNSNMQLQYKIEEMTALNNDMLNLLTSTQIATIFLDKNLNIFRFTPSISSIMDLISSDIGRSIKQFTNKLEYSTLIDDLNEVLSTLVSKETEVRTPDNRFFWMRIIPYRTITDSIEGLVITFTDITEKKNQEEELIKYKNHLEELVEERTEELIESHKNLSIEQQKAKQYLDIASVMIITLDSRGKVTLANRKTSEILGYKQEEIIGSDWLNCFVAKEDKEDIKGVFEKLLTGSQLVEEYRENYVLTKSGEKKMIAWHNAFIRDENEQVIGFISSGQDITQQKKTQNELENSEKNLKRAQRAGNIGMWFFDVESKIMNCSEIFQEIIGIDKQFIPREEFIQVLAAGEQERLAKIFEEKFKGDKTFYIEYKIISPKDGKTKWILASGDLIFDAQGKPEKLLGTIQDITARIQASEELKESEEKFKNIFNYSITGIAIATITGDLIDVNSEFCKILGYPKEEILNRSFADFTHPADLSGEKRLMAKLRNGEKAGFRIEKRYVRANNEIVWADVAVTAKKNKNGEAELFIGTASDITHRKQAELQLKKNNEFIQTILNSLPIGVSTHNTADGKISYMNKKLEDIYGWNIDELSDLNSFFPKVYPDTEYREKIKTQVLSDIATGDPAKLHWENIIITQKSGNTRIINAVNIPYPENNNMISAVIDITELKKAEEEILNAKNEAERANALKSAFLANTSHEIRTPLNGIIGFSELLEENSPKNEKVRTYVNIIRNSGDQLLKIIDDIIDISKIDSNQLTLRNEIFEFNKLIDDTFYFHKHSKLYRDRTKIILKAKKESTELLVKSDRIRIKQILDNLITNALKHTDKGYIEFGYSVEPPGQITLYVKDTGIGIEQKNLTQIFERFVKFKSKSGTGLGLSIVKGLVDLLNGEIAIDSNPGNGTTFQVSFPISIQNTAIILEKSLIDSKLEEADLGNKKIMIAEDDINSYLLLEAFLKKTNAKLIHVQSGDQIISTYEKHKPDLILMDINMPRLNGIQATIIIRQSDQDTPIIAQTAYALEDEKQKCLSSGCNDYISKPIDKRKLLSKILRILQP